MWIELCARLQSRWLQETLAIMSVYPRVYTDISAVNWMGPREQFRETLLRFLRAGLGKRLMFGSDQMIWPDAFEIAVDAVESADYLSPEQKRDIFCLNAARFLRLDKNICQQ